MLELISDDEELELYVLLIQAHDILIKLRAHELRKVKMAGISEIRAAVLFIVQNSKEPVTPAVISRWLFRKPHSVSELLTGMEKDGLVKKMHDLEKKNLVRVTLTNKGKQAYNLSVKRELIDNTLSSLSEEQRRKLRAYLKIIVDKGLSELGIACSQ